MNLQRKTISKDEINRLDLFQFEGQIQLIEDEKHFDTVFDKIHQHSFVGFDTETKPSFLKGEKNYVSLVQIAIPDHVYLLRIHKTGLKNELLSFLENENINFFLNTRHIRTFFSILRFNFV